MHWHGLHMRNTPWMDGAAGVSHCAILPGETFTYRFVASPAGTHWYHSHMGTQRTMGLAGPLIVLPKSKEEAQRRRGSDRLPEFDKEFIMMVQDWRKESSLTVSNRIKHEAVSFAYGFESPLCFNSTKQADGVDCGVIPFVSGIINGKGRHYDRYTDEVENPGLPLETYRVTKGQKYRFRVICSSMTFAFRISVDQHPLHVIASDGHDVIAITVESFIISSGERYDFWIDASDLTGSGRYWIRAETIEYYQNGQRVKPGHVEAILQYAGASTQEPETNRSACTQQNPCHVLNCPYKQYPAWEHIQCIPITALRQAEPEATTKPSGDNFHEHFLNFHFGGLEKFGMWKPTVNGRKYQAPATPFQLYPREQPLEECDPQECEIKACSCTNVLRVPLGHVVQLVFTTTIKNPPGVLNGNSHPIHMHGHQFQVVKMGFPTYDPRTNFFQDFSPDLKCEDEECNRMTWSDPSWRGGNVPNITLEGAPRKDTVLVPVGGYVVVRFKADNPGFWYMHCHMEFHNVEGMALVLQAGDVSQMNAPPRGMKTCGDFSWTDDEFLTSVNSPRSPLEAAKDVAESPPEGVNPLYRIMAVVFAGTTTFFIFFSLFIYCWMKPKQGYTSI